MCDVVVGNRSGELREGSQPGTGSISQSRARTSRYAGAATLPTPFPAPLAAAGRTFSSVVVVDVAAA